MIYSDMHTHGPYSDGKGSFSEFAASARDKGLVSLGFSDHSPVPVENSWSMKIENMQGYLDEIQEIKKTTGNPDIYAGMELDYINGLDVKEYIGFDDLPLDYCLGSVHYVLSPVLKKHLEVDNGPTQFNYLVETAFDGDADAVFRAYYNNVRLMLQEYKPRIVAHIDLVTKNNGIDKYFDTRSRGYLDEVDATLETVSQFGAIVEINSGGISRGYMDRPYPSEYILNKCLDMGIPVALNSDAHSPGTLGCNFEESTYMLKDLGFSEIMVFTKGNWASAAL